MDEVLDFACCSLGTSWGLHLLSPTPISFYFLNLFNGCLLEVLLIFPEAHVDSLLILPPHCERFRFGFIVRNGR